MTGRNRRPKRAIKSRERSSVRVVGETPIARDFFAGQYAKIVEATFDTTQDFDLVDAAFVVGALTFVGRVEDAQMCFDGLRLRDVSAAQNPRTLAASRFFLGLASARVGDFERSHRLLVRDVRARARDADPWNVAFVFQGLACQRYFTGRYRAAARHGLRALRAAHVTHFGYLEMLANDLRGHALAQLGHYRAATTLLERAKVHSERLEFGMNAYAIECSIANYAGEHIARASALENIEALLARRSHDWYSKRALLAGAAIQLALRGRRTEAALALEEADRDALRSGARRAKVTNLIARLHVLRWSQGARACDELLPQTAGLVDEGDVAFRAELLTFEAFVARSLGDEGRLASAISQLRELTRVSEHYRARAALEQFEPHIRPDPFHEDEITPLLRDVVRRDRSVLPRLFGLGVLGPVPEALGLAPDRRILIMLSENALVLEDHGDVVARPNPPRWCAALLRALAGGATKEEIVSTLWGLRTYRPERHDPLIRTTIHRLRSLLGAPRADWIVVTDQGYACSVPVRFVGDTPADERPSLLGELVDDEPVMIADEVLGLTLPPQPPPRLESASRSLLDVAPIIRVLDKLVEIGRPASIRDLTRALGLSESTVLRALRDLIRTKRIVRMGHARSTRYEARR